ncbi:hypothetical protein N7462_003423 [Penicillium macrosclerotiorum]|uniref:uncharacterized protein n=1 Tax=Penicillium macrosclerotiorum TaxID=303699 RepID=UPI002547C2FF|nr:uncharacterized protein N7462_003423 [Penicillium macrosclerotiorum]KAJ5689031.1 hypothetical protein N7462_003423 [Penicillium macrosclerotiorum]
MARHALQLNDTTYWWHKGINHASACMRWLAPIAPHSINLNSPSPAPVVAEVEIRVQSDPTCKTYVRVIFVRAVYMV